MNDSHSPRQASLRPLPLAVLLATLGAAGAAFSAGTDLADEPLANPLSSTKPNIMFILDDSGSMGWEYSPDYVADNDVLNTDGTLDSTTAENDPAICFDHKDDDNGITTTPASGTPGSTGARLKTCRLGDPPYMSPDFNKQYYNPEIRYRPGMTYDGLTEYPEMTAANTANWTAVPTDPYGVQRRTQVQNEIFSTNPSWTTTSNTADLVTGYPDRIWCTSNTANWGDLDDALGTATGTPNAPLCVKNSGYNFPNNVYGYGKNTGSTGVVKHVYGAPYYYRLPVTEYCDTQDLNNCIAANPDGSNPNATTYPFPARMRWCSNSGTSSYTVLNDPATYTNSFASCQGKRVSSFIYPKAFGRVVSLAPTWANATTSFTVGSSGSATISLKAITIDGVNLISPATAFSNSGVSKTAGNTKISATWGTDATSERNAVATAIVRAINDIKATTGYEASCTGFTDYSTTGTCGGATVSVRAATPGTAYNGKTAAFATDVTGSYVAATGTVEIQTSTNPSSITNLTVNGSPIIAATVACNTTNESTCQQSLCNAINAYTATSGYSAKTLGQATCNTSSTSVRITAPAALGASANGWQIVETGSVNTTADNTTKPTLSGGASPTMNLIPLAPSPATFAGGVDGSPGFAPTRVGVNAVARTNILPGQTYPGQATYPSRTDCVPVTDGSDPDADGTVCSYKQEMTNFSNWYAYYRTRMQMMKSAAGRAFGPIDDGYRVGLITINFSTTKYLKIDDFTSGVGGHKESWYDTFYARAPSGGTPLREALARVGWLYSGKFNTGLTTGILSADDPVTVSCQPNYAILSTDGYWNGNAGQLLNATTMTNQDNVDSGWSKRIDGAFDGLQPSTTCGDTSTARSCGTLADVAMYYYKTDLRTGTSWPDTVQPAGKDTAQHQHMTTFTLGLGLDGYLSYRRDYDDPNLQTGDFYAITQNTKNWPAAKSDDPSALDDLWHTAVNGRGKFFSASNPADLSTGLTDTLSAITATTGAGAAAATSNLQPVAGDNFAFTAEYKTVEWTGDLKARTIDLNTGIVSNVELWSARDLLNTRDWTTRVLYTFDAADTLGSGGNQLRHFCWSGASGVCSDGSLTATELTNDFNPTALTHYPSLSLAQKAVITKEKLVDFLRGDPSNEDSGLGGLTDLFRNRTSPLGDVISAQPIYVKSTVFDYQDTDYAKFRTCTEGSNSATPPAYCDASRFPLFPQSRRGTVYVAANEGMLHAFETDVNNDPYFQTGGVSTTDLADDVFTGNNAGNGEERWAYVPGMLLPEMQALANRPYNHRYLLDGSPNVGDVCISTPCAGVDDWRTILVGGLNKGGRGYYALDITNPQGPKALWEFKHSTTCLTDAQVSTGTYAADCHLGLSFGNSIISKRKSDGKWVVYVTSGYNNVDEEFTLPGDPPDPSLGNGKGYLYMLDAYTGKILERISTGVGCDGISTTAPCVAGTVDPSGLGKINGWADSAAVNNTVLAIYGADLKGNLWKFDLDTANAASYLKAFKLATLEDPDGNPQPVTTRPELAYIDGHRAVFLGTGKLLGVSDKSTTQVQTVYGIRDDHPTDSDTIDARAETVAQSLGVHPDNPDWRTTTTNNPVDWDSVKGWHVDLPDTGERVNVDPILQLGTLTVASNVPSVDACTAGGYGYLNFFDIRTGLGIPTDGGSNQASIKIGGALIVGINVIQLPGGKVKAIVTTAANKQLTEDNPIPPGIFSGKRVSWRELIKEQ